MSRAGNASGVPRIDLKWKSGTPLEAEKAIEQLIQEAVAEKEAEGNLRRLEKEKKP